MRSNIQTTTNCPRLGRNLRGGRRRLNSDLSPQNWRCFTDLLPQNWRYLQEFVALVKFVASVQICGLRTDAASKICRPTCCTSTYLPSVDSESSFDTNCKLWTVIAELRRVWRMKTSFRHMHMTMGYPYYAHPYWTAAWPTWLTKNRAGRPYLDGGNGDHGVFATEESPGTEGSEGNQSSKHTESALSTTEAPTYSYLVKIIPPTNKQTNEGQPCTNCMMLGVCMVAKKATLQLLIACSQFAYCISHSRVP